MIKRLNESLAYDKKKKKVLHNKLFIYNSMIQSNSIRRHKWLISTKD